MLAGYQLGTKNSLQYNDYLYVLNRSTIQKYFSNPNTLHLTVYPRDHQMSNDTEETNGIAKNEVKENAAADGETQEKKPTETVVTNGDANDVPNGTTDDSHGIAQFEREQEKEEIDFEDIMTRYFPTIGWYQLLVVGCALMAGSFSTFHYIVVQFMVEIPRSFWCNDSNGTRVANASKLDSADVCKAFDSGLCVSWGYETSSLQTSEETLVTELNLYCQPPVVWAVVKSTFYLGCAIGVIIFGKSADIYGRRTMAIFCSIGILVCGMMTAVFNNIITFIVFRMLTGLFTLPAYKAGYILGIELLSIKHRALAMPLSNVYTDLAKVITALLALGLVNWRWLQVAGTAIDIIPLVLLLTIVPESPRWLAGRGNNEKALNILRLVARRDGRPLPDHVRVTAKCEKAGELRELVRTPTMRKNSLCLFYAWFITVLVFYAIYLNTGKYVTPSLSPAYVMMIFACCELFIVDTLLYPIVSKFGRKKPQVMFATMASVALFASAFASAEMKTVCGIVGITTATFSFDILYVRTVEIYPTLIRNVGIGFCSQMGRYGSIVFPFVDLAGYNGFEWLPAVLYATMMLFGAVLLAYLPETRGVPLPDTVREAENMRGSLHLKLFCSKIRAGCGSTAFNGKRQQRNVEDANIPESKTTDQLIA